MRVTEKLDSDPLQSTQNFLILYKETSRCDHSYAKGEEVSNCVGKEKRTPSQIE